MYYITDESFGKLKTWEAHSRQTSFDSRFTNNREWRRTKGMIKQANERFGKDRAQHLYTMFEA
jgi:hypothetical protein